jgi:hypothetical protein
MLHCLEIKVLFPNGNGSIRYSEVIHNAPIVLCGLSKVQRLIKRTKGYVSYLIYVVEKRNH